MTEEATLNLYERLIMELASKVLFKRFISGAKGVGTTITRESPGMLNNITGKWQMIFHFIPDEEK